jgi:hypothetical protein
MLTIAKKNNAIAEQFSAALVRLLLQLRLRRREPGHRHAVGRARHVIQIARLDDELAQLGRILNLVYFGCSELYIPPGDARGHSRDHEDISGQTCE